MAETSKRRITGPPHNPGVRELVHGKRTCSKPLTRDGLVDGFQGWNERGYLPHRDEPGLIQFVTFHLADSFPSSLRSEWEALLSLEDDRERRLQFEKYLDQGRGRCYLRQARIAKLIAEWLFHHHSQWYELQAWVVMPNHVHLLIETTGAPLSKIIQELKRYTGRQANKILNRTGAFWSPDYFDTYMRDGKHQLKTRNYIENNPVKALLVQDPKEWLWSSACFRDKNGNLCID